MSENTGDRMLFNAAMPESEKRQAFVDGLCEKAVQRPLTREEAFLILQGILADMLTPMLPDLEKDAATAEGVARTNAFLMVDIARGLRDEMLAVIDRALRERSLVVVAADPAFQAALRKAGLR